MFRQGNSATYWATRFHTGNGQSVRIAELAAEKFKRRDAARSLPLDFAVPLLRECGDAGEHILQEWWGTCWLVRSLMSHPSCRFPVHALRSMSRRRKILDAMLSGQPLRRENVFGQVTKASGLSVQQANVSFHNLERLGFFTTGGTRPRGFAFDLLSACYPHADRITSYREEQKKLSGHILTE